jgi:hypothetical protein
VFKRERMTYIDPKSLFLQFYIDIFKSNSTSEIDSSIGNDYINTFNPLILDLLNRLVISPITHSSSITGPTRRVVKRWGTYLFSIPLLAHF